MKIARALQRADDGQADCFWHDNSQSMRYLIVMQGVTARELPETAAVVMAQREGRVNAASKAYLYVSMSSPGLLPGASGPLTVLLVL